MKLFVMQYSSCSCHLIYLRSKFTPQHHVFKHPPSIFLHALLIIRWKHEMGKEYYRLEIVMKYLQIFFFLECVKKMRLRRFWQKRLWCQIS
jgi:hypothetical protein